MIYGSRRHRIKIETETSSPNDSGQPVRSWSTLFASVPAALVSQSQYEADASKKQSGRASVVFETQYLSTIERKDRVTWLTNGDRVMGITGAVDPDGMRRVLQITCEESV